MVFSEALDRDLGAYFGISILDSTELRNFLMKKYDEYYRLYLKDLSEDGEHQRTTPTHNPPCLD